MKIEIKNRWSGKVQFSADVDCAEDARISFQIGLAVKWAFNSGADLSGAVLSNADLRGADLSNIPRIPNIHRKIYAAASAPNAFRMSIWYTCETTHCRAGWAVTLARDEGKALENCIGPSAAGALIYIASDPTIERIPNWYLRDEDALEDMRICAEREASRAA